MKIIAGLGNPGPRYNNTRHNLGFDVLDALAEKLGTAFSQEKHQGLLATAHHAGEKVLLVKPLTFMNRSGDCLAKVARNKVDAPEQILVVVDDINLPTGRLRMRADGSAGGHNGLKSCIERLGTRDFPRLRMGIGIDKPEGELTRHVLGKFHPDEFPVVKEMVARGADASLCWLEEGVVRAMSAFNR